MICGIFSFSEKMKWAEELKKEYIKIAKENQGTRNDLCENVHIGMGIYIIITFENLIVQYLKICYFI